MNPTLRRAFLFACALDVAVAKPGNVSIGSPGHDMDARMFIDSARAALPGLLKPGAPVGERIEAAVRATRAAVGCNTNLGILLLCAPIALAVERWQPPAGPEPDDGLIPDSLANELDAVLAGLTVADASAAYRAIAHANPGGLGDAPEQSVHAEPSVTLLAAMRLAADRDLIAAQYANGYTQVRGSANRFADGRPEDAMLAVFMGLLARFPDSHIARKRGTVAAQIVTDAAAGLWLPESRLPSSRPASALAEWDAKLKRIGINPGTTADLSVASAFMAACVDAALPTRVGSDVTALIGMESDS
ncbi:triphosphoribosyl-dephospho-CoA synthase [Derxia lacustris]|uniref:triphosphoribosyl-dephospho-CoA synthase n=1 Tax=Derxia lacustris TaxID=764842 RepID=UPI000A16E86A|nr:triphosphoribosyl-dephospho-CoA synthase [Derxia lacustris]